MKLFATAAAMSLLVVSPALAADDTWSELQPQIFGDAGITAGSDAITLDMPYRAVNDPRTMLGATVRAPLGQTIESVTLIIDENPMPVSAVFDLATPQRSFTFNAAMRMNGPSPVRVVAKTSDGALLMQSALVKTSGVGACAAAPTTDPVVAMETLGQMNLGLAATGSAETVLALAETKTSPQHSGQFGHMTALNISHPSHSGMQMDQITLLYIPARYVETIEVKADGVPLFKMTGSISLSENPALGFELPQGTTGVDVRMIDTKGAVFEKSFPLISG